MWQTLSVLLLVGNAIQLYFMWKFDRDADAASAEAERIRETLLPTQEELIQAQDEIVKLDRELAALNAALETVADVLKDRTVERDEANQSAEHWKQRYELCDSIRQKLAESLAGRANGRQITLGLNDAKIVHGSVVVSDKLIPEGFICRKLGSISLTDTLLLWNGEKKQMKDVELTDELAVLAD